MNTIELVVIGISTGGPPALEVVLQQLPFDLHVPIIIVQHMSVGFTKSLAKRLDRICALRVCEAVDGEIIVPGKVCIAPAGMQTQIIRKFDKLVLKITMESPISTYYKPSLDVTLLSLVKEEVKGTMAVVMTGMGNDGLKGIKEIKAMGALIIAQSEETCVVYGMPRACIEAGFVDCIIPLNDIASKIIECVKS